MNTNTNTKAISDTALFKLLKNTPEDKLAKELEGIKVTASQQAFINRMISKVAVQQMLPVGNTNNEENNDMDNNDNNDGERKVFIYEGPVVWDMDKVLGSAANGNVIYGPSPEGEQLIAWLAGTKDGAGVFVGGYNRKWNKYGNGTFIIAARMARATGGLTIPMWQRAYTQGMKEMTTDQLQTLENLYIRPTSGVMNNIAFERAMQKLERAQILASRGK